MQTTQVRAATLGAKRWVGRVVLAVCVGLLAVASFQVLSGRYQVHPVLTGSMRPGFAIGSVVVVKRVPVSKLSVRDVLLFHKPTDPTELVVHRIVSLSKRNGTMVIQTKGDDNPVRDPWTLSVSGRSAYTAQYTIPYVGYAATWLHQPQTRLYGMFSAAAALALAAAVVLFRRETGSHDPADVEAAGV